MYTIASDYNKTNMFLIFFLFWQLFCLGTSIPLFIKQGQTNDDKSNSTSEASNDLDSNIDDIKYNICLAYLIINVSFSFLSTLMFVIQILICALSSLFRGKIFNNLENNSSGSTNTFQRAAIITQMFHVLSDVLYFLGQFVISCIYITYSDDFIFFFINLMIIVIEAFPLATFLSIIFVAISGNIWLLISKASSKLFSQPITNSTTDPAINNVNPAINNVSPDTQKVNDQTDQNITDKYVIDDDMV